MKNDYKRIKYACYMDNVAMSVVIIMPSLLFTNFRELYGISYTLLGLLVLINFTSQLIVDLIFSFYSHRFNIERAIKSIPIITIIGLLIYAFIPLIFPQYAYMGLVTGTIIFSAACGFSEVLISPVIAAIPSDNPDKEMSKLHSVYAWGVVGVVIFSTVVLNFISSENWYILVLLLLIIPIICMFLFLGVELPDLEVEVSEGGIGRLLKNKAMIFCIVLIFFAGASEIIISQWSSNYLEQMFHLPKMWGDMLGVAMFAAMLGVGRTLYAIKGKNIEKTMLVGAAMASICYVLLVFFDVPMIGLFACAFSGYCVSMLWPGTLLIVQDKVPGGGVAMFALMASGGDLGAAIGPQLVGVVTDIALKSERVMAYSLANGYTPEQISMKLGMLVALAFPIMATLLLWKNYRK